MSTQKANFTIKGLYSLLPYMDFAFKSLLWLTGVLCVFVFNHLGWVIQSFYGYLIRLKDEKKGRKGSKVELIDGEGDENSGVELFQLLEGFLFGENEGFGSDYGVSGRFEEEEEKDDSSLISSMRYQVYSEDSFSGFIKEPEAASFTVKEMFVDPVNGISKKPEKVTGETVAVEKGFRELEVGDEAREGLVESSGDIGRDVSRVDPEVAHDDKHPGDEKLDEEFVVRDGEQFVSADRNEGSVGSVEVLGDADHDEKTRASISSSGEEERSEIQGKVISDYDDASEGLHLGENDLCKANQEDQGSSSSSELADDHRDAQEVPDGSPKPGTPSSVLDVVSGNEEVSSLYSRSVTHDVEEETIGPNKAMIDGDVKVESSSEDDLEKKEKTSFVANDSSKTEDIIISSDDAFSLSQVELPNNEQESVGSNEPASDHDEKLDASVSESSREETLETKENATSMQDSPLEREGGMRLNDFFANIPEFYDDDDDSVVTIEVLPEIPVGEASVPDPLIIIHDNGEDSPASAESWGFDDHETKESAWSQEHTNANLSDDNEDSTFKVLGSTNSSKVHDEHNTGLFGDDSDDETDEEILWLYQQKLKLRKAVRTCKFGLPTILEELESLRLEDDLKPLKVDPKTEHKERMDEIQSFYKSYSDKMRKLDILSHQTLNAIGLTQLKNQDRKLSASAAVKSFLPYKVRRQEVDPLKIVMRDLQRDLELVYVGQLCLSWEILKWQYGKALDLQDYDSWGSCHYNVAAGEFQQFHVLVQRFTEDEHYQGPRIQHYLRNRCAQCNLLQVPVIKDDAKNGRGGDSENAINITGLVEIVDESLHAFWEFLQGDKGETNTTFRGISGSSPELQDPSDMELLTLTRASLQKKERRLKDLIRSGNCIVKRFQKHKKRRLSQDMFVAQVELRLVSRVIRMSKLTTDQLLWCHKKASKVNFVGGQVQVDSNFLLFPC
ncbi:hypothetical protein Droror1_Dr00018768 [Drosera rotundifolia]